MGIHSTISISSIQMDGEVECIDTDVSFNTEKAEEERLIIVILFSRGHTIIMHTGYPLNPFQNSCSSQKMETWLNSFLYM